MQNGNAVVVVRAVIPDLLCPSTSERAFPGLTKKTNDCSLSQRFFLFHQFALMLLLLLHNSFKKNKKKSLPFKDRCKSDILCNNHRLGVDVLSICVLILSVVNSIDCSPIYERLQTLLHGVTSNRPCFSPQHVPIYSNLCSVFPCDSEFYAVFS